MNLNNIKELCKLVRYFVLKSTTEAGSGHPSSSLSAVELLTTLLFGGFLKSDLNQPRNSLNDRLIFSKGHAAPLFYSLYAAAGKISTTELYSLRKFGSNLEGHPTMFFPFTEAATGSLGQGLGIGLGLAMNAKFLDKTPCKTFVLLGDSEMAEGSVWETIQLANYYKVNNLIGILDVNGLGQRGETMQGKKTSEFEKRLKAFGWRTYVVDGHDLKQIISAYKKTLKEKNSPVMIIAKTVKGKGVKFMENKVEWHGKAMNKEELEIAIKGLGKIDENLKGNILKPAKLKLKKLKKIKAVKDKYKLGEMDATREAYGKALDEVCSAFPDTVVLDAEVSNSTGAGFLKKFHPEKFFEMFIAEQNMVSVAAGLSRMGKIPFISTFSAFFTRAADQIRMSAYSNSNIKFVGSHCGVSIGEDGASQMGLEDISMFRNLFGSVVLYPADANSASKLVMEAAKHYGNVYIRTTRAKTEVIYEPDQKFAIGKSMTLRQSDEDEVAVVAAGVTLYEALKAYDKLLLEGIKVRVIDLYSIKPIDKEILIKAAKETKAIITVEDHYESGGIGEAVAAALSEANATLKILAVKKMPRSGKESELLSYEEIDCEAIVKTVKNLVWIKSSVAGVKP